ncbi:MAG: Hsp70 family protein [Oligoflexia bacterium]|nr:Hsp70 family protein [Oligoflexia bacterium]
MEQKTVFGIDLGTTNSCIARFDCSLINTFEIIEIDNAKTVPSVVAYDEIKNQWLIGESAKNYSKIYPSNAISSIKREMGKNDFSIKLGPHTLNAEEVSSKILSYLKEKTEEKLNIEINDVVITVPAYFNDLQRRATLNAGIMAKLNVLRIINEPTAAALIHEISQTSIFPETSAKTTPLIQKISNSEKWIVYDLGGGTFDVSIIEAKAHYKEVLASTGNNNLGGDNFDNILACHLLEQIIKSNPHLNDHLVALTHNFSLQAKLKNLAEEIKIALSTHSNKEINDFLELSIDTDTDTDILIPIKLSISRDKFQALIEPLVDSTIELLTQALQLANCRIAEISKLLLVGGSTKIPLIKEKLFTALGLHGDSYIDPDTSVALGAAVQAAISAKLNFDNIIIDVSPHSLGVAAFGHIDLIQQLNKNYANYENYLDNESDHGEEDNKNSGKYPKTFIPVIIKNSKLPAIFEKTFYTSFPHQDQIEINIFQGESQNTDENIFIGSFVVNLKPNVKIVPLNLSMEYDLNGIIKISMSSLQKEKIVNSYHMNLHSHTLPPTIRTEAEVETKTSPKPTNYLIAKIEGMLKKQSQVEINDILEQYRLLLADCSTDEQININLDLLENKLYDWIESQPS